MNLPCPHCGTMNHYEEIQPGRLMPCARCNKFFLCPDPTAPPPRVPSGRTGQMRAADTMQQPPGSGSMQSVTPRSGPANNVIADLQKQLHDVRQLVHGSRGQAQVEFDAFRRETESLRHFVQERLSAFQKDLHKTPVTNSHVEELEDSQQQLAEQLLAAREQQDELFRMVRGLKEAPAKPQSASIPPEQLQAVKTEVESLRKENALLRKLLDERTQDLSELWQSQESVQKQAKELEKSVSDLVSWKSALKTPADTTAIVKELRAALDATRLRCGQLESRLDEQEKLARQALMSRDTSVLKAPVKTDAVKAPVVSVEPPPTPPPPTPVAATPETKPPSVINWLQGLAPSKAGIEKTRDQLFQLETMHAELENLQSQLDEKDKAIAGTLADSMAFQGSSPDSAGGRESNRFRDLLKGMEAEREKLREQVGRLESQVIELSEVALQKKLSGELGPDPKTNWQHGIHFQLLVEDEPQGGKPK